ncbi:MAG: hypothetical protein HKN32_10375 [Flavobacteriales bacterium]|nr:hypothetical protein [Flavobacteriales bacterium]
MTAIMPAPAIVETGSNSLRLGPFTFGKHLKRWYEPFGNGQYGLIVTETNAPLLVASSSATNNDGDVIKWKKAAPSLTAGPWLMRNHYTNEGEVLWQDNSHQLHLISASGNELWKARVDGQILGDVTQIDIYRNDKLQMIFSTEKSIYCLDRNGNLVDGYPIRLSGVASSPVAALDYDNNRKYRILIGLKDGSIGNYGVDGKPISGWKFEAGNSEVITLEHIRIRGKDYVFALEKDGTIHLLKRNGTPRFEAKSSAAHHASQDFYFIDGETIGKTKMIYPDTTGNIVVLQFDQAVADYGLTGFSAGTHLLVTDITGDNKEDFVVADTKEVRAYDSDFKRLFKKSFETAVSGKPKAFSFSGNQKKIGIIVGEQQYLLDLNGDLQSGFPMPADRGFIIFDLDRDGNLEVVGHYQDELICRNLN